MGFRRLAIILLLVTIECKRSGAGGSGPAAIDTSQPPPDAQPQPTSDVTVTGYSQQGQSNANLSDFQTAKQPVQIGGTNLALLDAAQVTVEAVTVESDPTRHGLVLGTGNLVVKHTVLATAPLVSVPNQTFGQFTFEDLKVPPHAHLVFTIGTPGDAGAVTGVLPPAPADTVGGTSSVAVVLNTASTATATFFGEILKNVNALPVIAKGALDFAAMAREAYVYSLLAPATAPPIAAVASLFVDAVLSTTAKLNSTSDEIEAANWRINTQSDAALRKQLDDGTLRPGYTAATVSLAAALNITALNLDPVAIVANTSAPAYAGLVQGGIALKEWAGGSTVATALVVASQLYAAEASTPALISAFLNAAVPPPVVDPAATAAADTKQAITTATQAPQGLPPAVTVTPGNNGTLTTQGVTTSSVELTWTDASGGAGGYQYRIYYGTSSNFNTPQAVQANGTPFDDYTAALALQGAEPSGGAAPTPTPTPSESSGPGAPAGITVSNLAAGTLYFINILVRDSAGYVAIYNQTSFTTMGSEPTGPGSGSGTTTSSGSATGTGSSTGSSTGTGSGTNSGTSTNSASEVSGP